MGVRDSASRIVNAFGRGYEAVVAPFDEPGPEGKVSPFAPGTVTPGAIAAKSLASLIYGHRAAANARVKREQDAKTARYHDLQTQALEQKLAPKPAATMTDVDVPGVGKVPMTREEIARKAPTFGSGTAAPAKRIIVPGNATDLVPSLRSYNPEDGTADAGEYSAAAVRRAQNVSGDHWKQTFDTRGANTATRLTRQETLDQIAASKMKLDSLKQDEEVRADEGATRSRQQYEAAQRILLDPKQSPTQRAKAARMLGVRPQMTSPVTDDKGAIIGTPSVIRDASGAEVYDQAAVKAAVEAKTKAARQWHLNRIRQLHATERLLHEQAVDRLMGRDPADTMPAEDPIMSQSGVEDPVLDAPAADGPPAPDWKAAAIAALDSLSAPTPPPTSGKETAGQRAARYYPGKK